MMTRSLTSAVYSGKALTAHEADRRAGRRRVRSDRAAGARHSYAQQQMETTLAIARTRSLRSVF